MKKKKTTKRKKITWASPSSEPRDDIKLDILCTCDDDPEFCEVHKQKFCTCEEDPGYCQIHDFWA